MLYEVITGAVFANAYYCFTTLNWGQSGRFIFSMAQWFTYNISQTELQSFPSDVKLLSIVYEDDTTNDLRMANDIFNTINIPATEKDYLRVKSDTINGYIYTADHVVPNNSAFDALDYYAYYRLFDAMCDYVFNGNLTGKDVALGNGSMNQISMPGGLHNLIHSDSPDFTKSQHVYLFPCSSAENPRQDHCDEMLAISEISTNEHVSIFPNPASKFLKISTDKKFSQVDILNLQGQSLKTSMTKEISIIELPDGLYFVKVIFNDKSFRMEKLIKD